MRVRTFVRCSASFAALAFFASPALAQDAGTPAAEQEAEAQPEADAALTQEGEPEIVVTGIRESLESTRALRRNSDQVIDAVVAEDIGKLPDLAVSDTAARIPGVQVVRTGGEASRVLVRGLPDFTTTYNGREIFTAETRVVALQDFPSSNIAALEVFKTSTANLVEPGLAGLVNVRSRRPFDFNEGQISASVWGLYSAQADAFSPNFNALLTDRWDVGDGEFGALLNFSYTEFTYLDSEPSNTDFIADPIINGQRVRFPDIQRLFYRSGNRVRPSVNVALQWRPSDNFELYAEGLYQGFRNKVDDRLIAVPLYGGGSYTNLVFRPGTNQLSSGTINGLADPIFTFQGATYNKTDTYQIAVGAIYESGPLRLALDLARTDTTFTGSTESVDRIFAGQGGTSVDFDLETPTFTIRNIDPTNISSFLFDGLYEESQESTGQDWQARFDATYTVSDFSFLRSLQAGIRYTDREAHREFGNRFAGFRGQNIPATNLPLEFRLTPEGFRGADIQGISFLSPTYGSIRENLTQLRQFVISRGGAGYTTADVVAPTLFDAREETIAGYAQVNFGIGEWLDAVVGIRGVQTSVQVVGGAPGPIPQFNAGSEFTDWLPNASLRARITPQLQFRLSATQTRTRPNFADLNPSGTLGAPPSACTPDPADPFRCARRGSTGNPFLQSLQSENYDASLEYYFSRTGFAALTVFRRDLFGFVQNQDISFVDPTLGPLIINQPINTGAGRIDGAEFQVQTFFDFGGLPSFLRNFGIQANVTYLDAKTGFPNNTGGFDLDNILGVSEWSYNIVGLYENGPLSARLTYNQRSEYLDVRQNRGDDLYLEYAQPGDRVDFSLNYNIMENATIFFDWTNILMEPFGATLESGRAGATRTEYPRFLRFEETTVSLGLRFRL